MDGADGMDVAQVNGNPYDFRSPVRQRGLLAAREREIAEIDAFLREALGGRPVHFSLFGEPGSGKSSLLNAVAELAQERRLLPVRLLLTESVVETELEFYRAVYEATLQSLIDAGHLDTAAPLMRAWLLQTCTGDLAVDLDTQPLELGLLIAARVQGRRVGEIPLPLLQRDLRRLLDIDPDGSRGMVLCLDTAERIDDNRDLAPSLMALADSTPALTIVTAAESAGRMQEAAPRTWGRVEVGPFSTTAEVFDAIMRPLEETESESLAPSPVTAADIRELTGGMPYEVNLVCHFIWDAIHQGEQAEFELSSAVIERVLAELEEKGRHESSPQIAAFSSLTKNDYETILRLAPYEALTTRQIALVSLLLEDYDEARLQEEQRRVEDDLTRLAKRGVVRVENDRFEILGGREGRLYLKYAAQRVAGKRLRYHDGYPRPITIELSNQLGAVLVGDDYASRTIFATGRPHEMGGGRAGDWLTGLNTAIRENDLAAVADYVGPYLDLKDIDAQEDGDFLVSSILLQVGLHDVEHAEIVLNADGEDIDAVRDRGRGWLRTNGALFAKYDVRVLDWHCETFSRDNLRAAVTYFDIGMSSALSFILYRAGATEAAERHLEDTVAASESIAAAETGDPLLRAKRAEAIHRLGFIAATRADWETARSRLKESRELSLSESWLLDYNTAYVEARSGRLAEAAALTSLAVERIEGHDGLMILHAHFPTPDSWVPPGPRWNVVEVHGRWIDRLVSLQNVVLHAAADLVDESALRDALGELDASAPVPLLRLAGWAELTLLNRPDEAEALFRRAVDVCRYDQTAIPQSEADFAASQRAEGRDT